MNPIKDLCNNFSSGFSNSVQAIASSSKDVNSNIISMTKSSTHWFFAKDYQEAHQAYNEGDHTKMGIAVAKGVKFTVLPSNTAAVENLSFL